MAEVTRNTILAIKEETTENSPIKPTSGSDGYLALQEGFSMEPAFETLENAELVAGSIGKAKSLLGLESPTLSLDHYLRHSAVEGQEPDFGLLIESCMGDKTVNATEYDTVAGSTTSIVNVDTGEGASFERGQALLVKDGTNGYSIRNVYSIATDALTLGHQLSSAPASGVNLGKAIVYKPGTAHPSFSAWLFRGDGGALEAMSGSKITEMSVTVEAGQYVNASFSAEGAGYYFNPILVDATNNKVNFDDGGGEETATLTNKLYKDPHQLAEEIQSKMDALTTDNITVVYSDTTGKFTITSDGGTFSILWKTGANGSDNTDTHIGTSIGFSDAADDTGAVTYTSDSALDLGAFHIAVYDTSDPLVAKNNQVMIGDADDITCFEASSLNFTVTNTKADILSVCEESGKAGSVMTGRDITIEVVALLTRYESDKFKKFRNGDQIRFAYNFGTKTGTNWTAGKCCNIFSPTATITSFALGDSDGLVTLNMTLTPYVVDGLGELYVNFI